MLFFFFQAEDGIRDSSVTGVQSVLFRSALWSPPEHSSLSFPDTAAPCPSPPASLLVLTPPRLPPSEATRLTALPGTWISSFLSPCRLRPRSGRPFCIRLSARGFAA